MDRKKQERRKVTFFLSLLETRANEEERKP
jgi:hypothetical protein